MARGCKRVRGRERPSSAPASHSPTYFLAPACSSPANALSSRPKPAAHTPGKASPLSLPCGSLGAVDRARSRESGQRRPTQRRARVLQPCNRLGPHRRYHSAPPQLACSNMRCCMLGAPQVPPTSKTPACPCAPCCGRRGHRRAVCVCVCVCVCGGARWRPGPLHQVVVRPAVAIRGLGLVIREPDTRLPLTVQKVDVGTSSPSTPLERGELDTLPFTAAIWDRLAVYWGLSGPPTYFVSQRLQI